MNNIEKLFNQSTNAKQFATGYFLYLKHLLNKIDTDSISAFINELEHAHRQGKNIFVIGNGGSASTASHLANDLGFGIYRKSRNETPLRAISLTDNISIMSAISNDECYENVFLKQLHLYYQEGDILIAISASGNSKNIINSVEWVKSRNGKVIGLSGFDGGRLKKLSDVVINVETPLEEFGPVEDIHLIIGHLVSAWLQYSMNNYELTNIEEDLHNAYI
ncbi:D-sedoheptulose-7-phosphate isomerase [Paenibacillus wynnii]|uniref:D-sedoheptulose-7-phosphate isomerase n=1 Tax=Paenibacillus wynnii TaxID=268407 RepID=UPI0027917336|nr:SIS domain-containing protein [Paenibacillus wynnii]MDQ0193766.1 D-sedoheptulose 7-phosphate isomerase [Paenibacillus wynnii]